MKKMIFLFIISISFSSMHGMKIEKHPLHRAVKEGDNGKVRKLFESGCDVNVQNENGKPSLHLASLNLSDVPIYFSSVSMHGMEIERYPLHRAFREKKIDEASKLIESGCDVNIQNENGNLPLHLALFYLSDFPTAKKIEIIRLLLKKCANINIYSQYGCIGLHVASIVCDTDVINLLLEEGADPNAELKIKDKLSGKTSNGVLPLHVAIGYYGCHYECPPKPLKIKHIIDLLVTYGADIKKGDGHGKTMLHCLAMWNSFGFGCGYRFEDRKKNPRDDNMREILQYVILHGANINAQDKKGCTPLHEAIRLRNTVMEKFLIEHGADMKIKNLKSEVPEDLQNRPFRIHAE